jgi:DNA-binding XRE family transcriptional regulator
MLTVYLCLKEAILAMSQYIRRTYKHCFCLAPRGKYRIMNKSSKNKKSKKLTEESVCEIRKLYSDKSHTTAELANKFDVTSKTINDITTGKTWNLERIHREFNRHRKLTSKEAKDIREMYKTGKYFQSDLARKYNVNQTLISAVVRNKIWVEM